MFRKRAWMMGLLLPWLVGCSSLKLTYGQGPTLAYWWLEGSRFRPRPDRRIVASSTSVRDEVLQAYPHAAGMMSVIPPGP